MEHFGERIAEQRNRRGISQEELADRLNVSRQTVSSWENGRTSPSVDMLEQICRCLELDMSTFFEGPQPERQGLGRAGAVLAGLAAGIGLVHLVMALLGEIPLVCALTAPMATAAIYIIMDVSFRIGVKNGDLSMIAGFKPSDRPEKTLKTLRNLDLFSGLMAVICELLFLTVYFDERKLPISLVLLAVYVSFLAAAGIVCQYRSR